MTDNKTKGMGPVAAGVVGGAVGVAVGAAAVALTDEKNRKKAIKVMDEFRTQTTKTLSDITKQVSNMKGGKASKISRSKKPTVNKMTEMKREEK